MAIPDLINELKSHLEMRKVSLVLLSVLVGKPVTLKKMLVQELNASDWDKGTPLK